MTDLIMANNFKAVIFFLLFFLVCSGSGVLADQGKVLKVIDGDTFLAEVDGKGGLETIEVNLRCSDAPVIGSYFGKESQQLLEQLLDKSALISYKVQAYCGSEKCVEALAYIPDEKAQKTTYINTLMIEAGMARNNSCRGVFTKAEAEAKSAKKGIWSTSRKISFTEVAPTVKPKAARTAAKKTVKIQAEVPAIVRYDRAERTVTLKSSKISLTRVIKAIDAVSPTPLNIYLTDEEFIALNLDKIHWYDALQRIVETADLKQVNMDGKIDLYTRLFYYKHVAPYLKVSGNVGVYMAAGNGNRKELTKDDGTTHYVFINDFENSAVVAKQYEQTKRQNQPGFIEVHEGSTRAPANDYGTFARSDQRSSSPVASAVELTKEPVVVKPAPVKRAPLKPYSEEKIVVEEDKEPVKVAALVPAESVKPVVVVKKEEPATPPVVPESEIPAPGVVEKINVVKEAPVKSVAKPEQPSASIEQVPVAEARANRPKLGDKRGDASEVAVEFSLFHAVALVLIILVVVLGWFYLTRTAAVKAAEAEEHVEPQDLEEQDEALAIDADAQVDKEYEEEIFDQLDHVDSEPVEKPGEFFGEESVVDEIPEEDVVAEPVAEEPLEEEPVAAQVESVQEEALEQETEPEEAKTESEISEEKPEDSVKKQDESDQKVKVEEKKSKVKKAKSSKKKLKTKLSDEGNFAVSVDAYHSAVTGPQREPRTICLFEVKCSLDDITFTGIGLDISGGGLFIDSRQQFDIGKVVELEFKLQEDDENSIRCRGAVTWYNQRPDPIKPDYPNGFGVRFLEIDAAVVARIDEFLKPEEGTPGFMDQIENDES